MLVRKSYRQYLSPSGNNIRWRKVISLPAAEKHHLKTARRVLSLRSSVAGAAHATAHHTRTRITTHIVRILPAAILLLAFAPSHLFSSGDRESGPSHLSVIHPSSGEHSDHSIVAAYINEQFAEPNDIVLTWTVVPADDIDNNLRIRLASGNAPDVSFASIPDVASFSDRGMLAPLDDLIADYGSNITDTAWGAGLPYGKFGTDTTWAIPRPVDLPAINTGWVMRKDWLDNLDLRLPDSTDSFLETVKQVRDSYPAFDGFAVIGLSRDELGVHIRDVITSFLHPDLINSTRERAAYGWGLYPGNTLMSAPGFLEGLRFLNELNFEGLFSPDWAIESSHAMYASIADDRVFTAGVPYFRFLDRMAHFRQGEDGMGHWVPLYPFKASDGLIYKYAPPLTTDALFVPANTAPDSAINAMKYLNWHADPSGHNWMQDRETMGTHGSPPSGPRDIRTEILSCGPFCTESFITNYILRFPYQAEQISAYTAAASAHAFRSRPLSEI